MAEPVAMPAPPWQRVEDPSVRLELLHLHGNARMSRAATQPPDLSNGNLPVRRKLRLIQKYITSLEYNFTGESFFVIKKDRGFRHITSTAKLIMKQALPIQCVEAVFLAGYLTTDIKGLDRLPVSFKSIINGQVFRHMVLAVHSDGKWGALGLSRRECLMFKDLRYNALSELIIDFHASYESCWHQLVRVYVGFPFPHDVACNAPVKWKVMRADVSGVGGDCGGGSSSGTDAGDEACTGQPGGAGGGGGAEEPVALPGAKSDGGGAGGGAITAEAAAVAGAKPGEGAAGGGGEGTKRADLSGATSAQGAAGAGGAHVAAGGTEAEEGGGAGDGPAGERRETGDAEQEGGDGGVSLDRGGSVVSTAPSPPAAAEENTNRTTTAAAAAAAEAVASATADATITPTTNTSPRETHDRRRLPSSSGRGSRGVPDPPGSGSAEVWARVATDLDRFAACAERLLVHFSATGQLPDHPSMLRPVPHERPPGTDEDVGSDCSCEEWVGVPRGHAHRAGNGGGGGSGAGGGGVNSPQADHPVGDASAQAAASQKELPNGLSPAAEPAGGGQRGQRRRRRHSWAGPDGPGVEGGPSPGPRGGSPGPRPAAAARKSVVAPQKSSTAEANGRRGHWGRRGLITAAGSPGGGSIPRGGSPEAPSPARLTRKIDRHVGAPLSRSPPPTPPPPPPLPGRSGSAPSPATVADREGYSRGRGLAHTTGASPWGGVGAGAQAAIARRQRRIQGASPASPSAVSPEAVAVPKGEECDAGLGGAAEGTGIPAGSVSGGSEGRQEDELAKAPGGGRGRSVHSNLKLMLSASTSTSHRTVTARAHGRRRSSDRRRAGPVDGTPTRTRSASRGQDEQSRRQTCKAPTKSAAVTGGDLTSLATPPFRAGRAPVPAPDRSEAGAAAPGSSHPETGALKPHVDPQPQPKDQGPQGPLSDGGGCSVEGHGPSQSGGGSASSSSRSSNGARGKLGSYSIDLIGGAFTNVTAEYPPPDLSVQIPDPQLDGTGEHATGVQGGVRCTASSSGPDTGLSWNLKPDTEGFKAGSGEGKFRGGGSASSSGGQDCQRPATVTRLSAAAAGHFGTRRSLRSPDQVNSLDGLRVKLPSGAGMVMMRPAAWESAHAVPAGTVL